VIADDLKHAPLFAGLGEGQLDKLAGIAWPLTLGSDASVFLEGDRGDAFYLLVEGVVKVAKTFTDGRSATVRYVHAGETFGESVLFNDTYPSSTETLEPSRLYRFNTDEFRSLMLAEPELALLVMAAMARLLVILNQRVEELLLPVPARLARCLLELCSEQATPTECRVPFSRRELAARLGTVPETLSRTLHRFVAGGLVAVHGNAIEVLKPAALERLAQQQRVATQDLRPSAHRTQSL
jgi:CRP-like cAMP-binding protein